MPKPDDAELLTIDGHTVRVSSPAKLYFSRATQLTKLEIIRYFLSVAPGTLAGYRRLSHRPQALRNKACLAKLRILSLRDLPGLLTKRGTNLELKWSLFSTANRLVSVSTLAAGAYCVSDITSLIGLSLFLVLNKEFDPLEFFTVYPATRRTGPIVASTFGSPSSSKVLRRTESMQAGAL